MVHIFKIRTNENLDENTYNSLLELVSKERIEKISKFRFREDSIRSLLGELLSRYSICIKTRYANEQLLFTNNSYGKPLLIYPDGISFNVSHSGAWIVCATADKRVGIDIERIVPINFESASFFFTKEEYSGLLKCKPQNQLRYFYLLWTLKESYIKADGRGFSLNLNTFSIYIENEKISIKTDNFLRFYHFYNFEIDGDHSCSVCSEDSNISREISEVTIDDLVNILFK